MFANIMGIMSIYRDFILDNCKIKGMQLREFFLLEKKIILCKTSQNFFSPQNATRFVVLALDSFFSTTLKRLLENSKVKD